MGKKGMEDLLQGESKQQQNTVCPTSLKQKYIMSVLSKHSSYSPLKLNREQNCGVARCLWGAPPQNVPHVNRVHKDPAGGGERPNICRHTGKVFITLSEQQHRFILLFTIDYVKYKCRILDFPNSHQKYIQSVKSVFS